MAIRFFLILLCLLPSVALAQPEPDRRTTTPDYSRIRYLGLGHGDSTSPCIGNPVTPECAAETRYACQEWWNKEVCAAVGHTPPTFNEARDTISTMSVQPYKFLLKRQIVSEDIPEYYKDVWRVGDTLIFTAAQVCGPFMHCYSRLKDKQSPLEQRQCPPIDCSPGDIYENGLRAPSIHIVREDAPGRWVSISYLQGWYLTMFRDQDDVTSITPLIREGLAIAPW